MKKIEIILWWMLLVSQLFLATVGYIFILPQLGPNIGNTPFICVLAVALVEVMLSHIFFVQARGESRNEQRLTRYIISWSLSESLVIFGVIMPVLGYGLDYMLGFWFAGILLHILHRPEKSKK